MIEIEFKDGDGVVHRASPLRDVAYFYPQLLLEAARQLVALSPADRERLATLFPGEPVGLKHENVLRHTYAAVCEFMKLSVDPDVKTPLAAIEQSGFLTMPPVAQQLMLEALSRVTLGAFWAGKRSSTLEGECPPVLLTLVRRGKELLEELSRRGDGGDEQSDACPQGAKQAG